MKASSSSTNLMARSTNTIGGRPMVAAAGWGGGSAGVEPRGGRGELFPAGTSSLLRDHLVLGQDKTAAAAHKKEFYI
jgi:hypothetical protein